MIGATGDAMYNMRYYILNRDVALRSWRRVPYGYYIRGQREAKGLQKEEYELLCQCDGGRPLPESSLLAELVKRGFASPCEKGAELTEWQKPRTCDNRYFPAMNWMITGKCNYNCLHCFNAADNGRLQSAFTWEEAKRLIEEAEICGINAFTITGGEPMLHPRFLDIVKEIHRRGMYVEEINTNGAFLTKELLEELRETGCRPLMKISFDGVGHHDWLRNRKGAEEEALRAMALCIENGFPVKAQTNVHRLNLHTMLPTVKLLDQMGVRQTRIIRTSEGPRWKQNAGDACLTLTEYYDGMLELAGAYIRTDRRMSLDLWQFLTIDPKTKCYAPVPLAYGEARYRDSRPVCQGNRGMVAVTAEGELVPCHQLSGYYMQRGWRLGNVKTDGLQRHLQEGAYLDDICTTLGDLKTQNETCGACPVFNRCAGGCRALALALTDEKLGVDPAKCLYFKEGYLDKTKNVMEGYRMAQR